MTRYWSSESTGQPHWPVVWLLLLIVLIPSASVLWLTNAAVRNERAAVRQRLVEAYQSRLRLAETRIDEHWRSVDEEIATLAKSHGGAALFQACIAAGLAQGVVIVEPDGRVAYPSPPPKVKIASLNPQAWTVANQLEFRDRAFADAAEAYAAIAAAEPHENPQARAWLAHARCLAKGSQREEAIAVLTGELNRPELRRAVDQDGRQLWLDAQLRATQLTVELDADPQRTLARQQELRAILEDYEIAIPSAQRQFAMREFKDLFPADPEFLTWGAEQLATTQLESLDVALADPTLWTTRGRVWFRSRPNSGVVLLFGEEDLTARLRDLVAPWNTADDEILALHSENSGAALSDPEPADAAQLALSALPGWTLSMRLNDPSLFENASGQQTALYSLAALLTIAAVAVGASATAIFVRRQLRLAQLKNDLAALVTHELRTPLASIRVLVDTLLDGGTADARQTDEYLNLIAGENERLSRLIENFLTFSRLDRNRQRFDLRESDPAELADRAVGAINGKLSKPSCVFQRQLVPNLPNVHVDPDAIVTVLLNLLDNALKFTGDEKQIGLRINRDEQFVRFDVEDNGVGMSPADARRAFERFYQADTRLSRSQGGCGLGLSLVRAIVEAHDGSVAVVSRPGSGSTFTVRLPIVSSQEIVLS